ncbi:Methyltransferase domain-containing protein [Mariprofundus ferrinatatus]|uniref:Methyltransferase domain-containing protein n=1 Tax=Mariprofundus ferrinatatus TaxID=1921087 RepID=A0A2K8L735_9PROT|nr:rhodoquinone biosynthesis methyltransferase RquA [Mariprofundus ferrinatatus]ATX83063.1 Methyltransferase domain-containing protein [Mariprofundus ferrinatatus]
MFRFYRHFLDGMPIYLVRHYWWAYLWPKSVWFFDHQPIINAILFGQYRGLMHATLERLKQAPLERVLQLTCVYGSLTPNLICQVHPSPLHIIDVADVQLDLARSKVEAGQKLCGARMNAESLGYKANSFSTVILFFLLHEMPAEARRNTLAECMRVIRDGGVLLVTEYGRLPKQHWLYRFYPIRWITTRLEPFLESFWHDDVEALLNELGEAYEKEVRVTSHRDIFSAFYRVTEFTVTKRGG